MGKEIVVDFKNREKKPCRNITEQSVLDHLTITISFNPDKRDCFIARSSKKYKGVVSYHIYVNAPDIDIALSNIKRFENEYGLIGDSKHKSYLL